VVKKPNLGVNHTGGYGEEKPGVEEFSSDYRIRN